MSRSIAISIEGPDADDALDEFFAIAGIVGEPQWDEPEVVYRDAGLIAAVGTIVSIVGGIASLVSSIIEWREKWKSAHADDRLSAVIQDAKGNRLLLDNATPEQIAAALQTLQG